MKRRKYTGIKDVKGEMIFEGDIVMEDSKVYWNKERAMWGISNGKEPLGDYKYREDFIKLNKKSSSLDKWKNKKITKPSPVKFDFIKKRYKK
jgi:hypothetical protein